MQIKGILTRSGRKPGALALVAAGAVAGGVLAGTLSASAADTTTSTTPSASAPAAATAPHGGPGRGPGGPAPVRSDEKALSSSDSAKAKAAALKAVPGGTVYRVETDAGDGTYEAHMTKADGSLVTVKMDASFAVTKVETGMGQGDPAPAGAPTGTAPSGGTA